MSYNQSDIEDRADGACRQKQLESDAAKYQLAAYLVVNFNKTIPEAKYNPELFVAPLSVRWVTGLWLTSLGLSLIVALFAILAKQWLEEYSRRMRMPAASQRHWAWRHIMSSTGLSRWHMAIFIGGLPVALHGSLFLFLVGLAVFFWSLCTELAFLILSATGAVFLSYCMTTLAPAIVKDCPTRTPLLHLIRLIVDTIRGRPRVISRKGQALKDSDDPSPPYTAEICNERILAWMIEDLPASDDVRVAVDAMGSLLVIAHTKVSRSRPWRGLQKEIIMRTVIDRADSLLSADDTSSYDDMYRVIAARYLIDQLDRTQLIAQYPSHGSSAGPPPDTVPVSQYLQRIAARPDYYPEALYRWLVADPAVLSTFKGVQYLLALDGVMRNQQDMFAPVQQRLKIRTRLLCNELSCMVLYGGECTHLMVLVHSIMDDLARSENAHNYPRILEEAGPQVLPELHALVCLVYLLPVYAFRLPAHADVYADLCGAYETSLEMFFSTTTPMSQFGSQCALQCLLPLCEIQFAQTERSFQVYRGAGLVWLCGMDNYTPWSWDHSAVLAALLANLAKSAHSEEDNAGVAEITNHIIEATVVRFYGPTGASHWGTADLCQALEQDVSVRARISLLYPSDPADVNESPTSAWSIMCSILKPHQRSAGMESIAFEMHVILHQLHHRDLDVQLMYRGIFGAHQDEMAWMIAGLIRVSNSSNFERFCAEMAEMSGPSLWNQVVLYLEILSVNDWTLKDELNQPVSVVDLISGVNKLRQKKCIVADRPIVFKDEDTILLVPDEMMTRRIETSPVV